MALRVPSRGSDQFVVRMPDGMRERIAAAAEKNNRSMNSEIVAALEEKFPAPTPIQTIENMIIGLPYMIKNAETEEQKQSLTNLLEEFKRTKAKIDAEEEAAGRRLTKVVITRRQGEK